MTLCGALLSLGLWVPSETPGRRLEAHSEPLALSLAGQRSGIPDSGFSGWGSDPGCAFSEVWAPGQVGLSLPQRAHLKHRLAVTVTMVTMRWGAAVQMERVLRAMPGPEEVPRRCVRPCLRE